MNFSNDPYETCDFTPDWVSRGSLQLVDILGKSRISQSSAEPAPPMNLEFYSAIRSGDLPAAVGLCKGSKAWPKMVLHAIEKLDRDWQEDALPIGDIAESYWTIRRVLDTVSAKQARGKPQQLAMGSAAVYVPPGEKHTFGPQLLVDQLKRFGWSAETWIAEEADNSLSTLRTRHFDVLGVSIGCDIALDGLADTLNTIRQNSKNSDLFIVLGGAAFTGNSEQYQFLGADLVTTTEASAIGFFQTGWTQLKLKAGLYDG